MPGAWDVLSFGGYVLDGARRCVTRPDGSPLALTPRLFNALYLFASRPGELIDKRELMRALWPGLVVEENNLSQLISALRRALGDESAQLIRTEPRRGFRFTAEVAAMRETDETGVVSDAKAKATRATLAVLPFVALSPNDRDRLVAVGMADSLIARLSILPELVVRSFGSVRRFAEGQRDAVQAGRVLDVTWVVDGTLMHVGDRLRASARLLWVPDGTAAWSDQFDVAWTDVFDAQDALCERVAHALGRHLRKAPGGTRNIDAYQLYLAGLNHAQALRADALQRSVELFGHALQIDPVYSLAHVGIAEAHRRMIFGSDRPPTEVFGQWRQHLERALELTPELAEAHTLQGWLRYWCEHDWGGAEQAFRRALTLNPNIALASFGLGFMLLTIGRRDEGIDLVRNARELDPMSLLICTMEAVFLLRLGDAAASHIRLARVLEFAPQFWIAHMALATWHEQQGDLDAAFASIGQAAALSDQSTQAEALQGAMLARHGRADEGRKILARLEAQSRARYVPPTSLAAVQAALGERDAALASLELACDCNDTRLLHLRDDPRWVSLRAEPRYLSLVARMKLAGLPPGIAPP